MITNNLTTLEQAVQQQKKIDQLHEIKLNIFRGLAPGTGVAITNEEKKSHTVYRFIEIKSHPQEASEKEIHIVTVKISHSWNPRIATTKFYSLRDVTCEAYRVAKKILES